MNTYFSYVAIPCANFDKAFGFYNAITAGRLERNTNVPFPMAYFKNEDGENVGHLFQLNGFMPGADGPLVYLKLSDDLSDTLSKIEEAGGKIIMPRTMISPAAGYWAIFLDTEGNKLALHSDK